MLKIFLKNQKGQQVIEVLIALFLTGFFVSGLMGFYEYTADFQTVKDFTSAERHFTFIQNLFSQNCDSFVGDSLRTGVGGYTNSNPIPYNQDPSLPQITIKSSSPKGDHRLLYSAGNIKKVHLLSSDEYIALKEINLERQGKNAFLKITFESLKTFKEYKKTMKLYLDIDYYNKVKDCSLKPILSCEEEDIEISYAYEVLVGTTAKKYSCFSSSGKKLEVTKAPIKALKGWLRGGPALPGETVSLTDTSSDCCICLIQLQCSEGYWSESSDCFKRKGKCDK